MLDCSSRKTQAALFPIIPQNTDPNLIKRKLAFGDASTALAPWKGKKKNPCLDFFTQGRSLQDVANIFKHFWETATDNPKLADLAGTKNSGQGMDATVGLGNLSTRKGHPSTNGVQ